MASLKLFAVLTVVALAIFVQGSNAEIQHRRHIRICKVLSESGDILKEKHCPHDEECTLGPKEYTFENHNGTETVSAFQCQPTDQPSGKVANAEDEDPRVQERMDRMAQMQVKRYLNIRKGFDHKNRRVHEPRTEGTGAAKKGFKAFGRAQELRKKMLGRGKKQ